MFYFESQNITHFALGLLMYFTMFFSGSFIEKSHSSKKYLWLIPILAMGLNSGLRYDRGIDYMGYFMNFKTFADGDIPGEEPGWHFICNLFYNVLNLEWPFLVLFLSIFLVFSGVVFIKKHSICASFALPLFAYYSLFAENLARWFFAFSFVLLALTVITEDISSKKNLLKGILLLLCAFSIHYGILMAILPIIFIIRRQKVLCKPYTAIILLLLIYLLFSPSVLGNYLNILSYININNRFDNYQDNMKDWISENDEYHLSFTNAIIYIIFIVKGYKVAVTNHKILPYYNVALFGSIISPAMLMLEISTRINYSFTFFQFLIFGYIFKDDLVNSKQHFISFSSCVVILLIFKYILYNSFAVEPEKLLYLWDIAFKVSL